MTPQSCYIEPWVKSTIMIFPFVANSIEALIVLALTVTSSTMAASTVYFGKAAQNFPPHFSLIGWSIESKANPSLEINELRSNVSIFMVSVYPI